MKADDEKVFRQLATKLQDLEREAERLQLEDVSLLIGAAELAVKDELSHLVKR